MRTIFSILFLISRGVGRALLSIINAAIALMFIGGMVAALANYTMTQGVGTTFGSIVVSTIHYAQQLICDPTTPSQCGAVDSFGQQKVDVNTSNNNLYAALTSATPVGSNVIGYTSNDPCAQQTKLGAVINLTASGQVITGTAAKKTYICSIDFVLSASENVALVEGTGTTCATNIFGLAGGTTAATGWNLTANGFVKGNGLGTVYSPSADTNATAANVCLLASSTSQISGQITYVQQ